MKNPSNLKAAAIAAVLAVICAVALLSQCAYANEVTDLFRAGNNAGTLFPSDRSLDGWRACTDKDIQFFNVRQDADRTVAYFVETGICRGQPERYLGVMMIWSKDGQITAAQWAPVAQAYFDLAAAGQAADVGTTAAGMARGITESNPIGLAALPIKYAALKWSKTLDLRDCTDVRAILGGFGWGAAAANLLTIAGAAFPPALAVGVIAGVAAYGPTKADAPAHCIED